MHRQRIDSTPTENRAKPVADGKYDGQTMAEMLETSKSLFIVSLTSAKKRAPESDPRILRPDSCRSEPSRMKLRTDIDTLCGFWDVRD